MSTRRTVSLAFTAAVGLALAACPLPQPVPDVARTVDGGVVTIPIILPESAVPADTTVYVKKDCAGGAQFTLGATVEDPDTIETVEARWFVDYLPNNPGYRGNSFPVSATGDPNDPLRPIPPLALPFDAADTATFHVVDVVVSNNFLSLNDTTAPFQRAAPPPFETQVYRWVFQYVDTTDARGRCN
jgi:hypothetical protein